MCYESITNEKIDKKIFELKTIRSCVSSQSLTDF